MFYGDSNGGRGYNRVELRAGLALCRGLGFGLRLVGELC